MYSQILINVGEEETRVALLEENQLAEYFTDRGALTRLSGSIYAGKVADVLPGMQAAFVDIGLPRKAFLYVGDIRQNFVTDAGVQVLQEMVPAKERQIEKILKRGQVLLVQVYKEPLAKKGARISANICIPGRYMVYMPLYGHIGISHRIIQVETRERLRDILEKERKGTEGFIVRTAAVHALDSDISDEIVELRKLWDGILERFLARPERGVIYQDLPLSYRVIRDLLAPEIDRVWVDNEDEYLKICQEIEEKHPDYIGRIFYYSDETEGLFDKYKVDNQLQKALERKVNLKSGGYIIFDQTEALTTIDVNTGGFTGKDNLEDTVFKINFEAISKISNQIRLRNLGGIIIIDFIDMVEENNRRKIFEELERQLQKDRYKAQIIQVSELGLIEVTRKRVGKSLEHVLLTVCPHCGGRGKVISPITLRNRIMRKLKQESSRDGCRYIVQIHDYYQRFLNEDDLLFQFAENSHIEIELQGLTDISINSFRIMTADSIKRWEEEVE